MKIKCLKYIANKAIEQVYDVDIDRTNLLYIKDSYVSLSLKAGINKDCLPPELQYIADSDNANTLYDAEFVMEASNCSVKIENIYSPIREKLLKFCCIRDIHI